MDYIPLYVIRDKLRDFYQNNHCCTTIFDVVSSLYSENNRTVVHSYHSPFNDPVESLTDQEFVDAFICTLYPISSSISASQQNDPHSYAGNTIFSSERFFHVFLHENYAKQLFHAHDFFEITYVFRGNCTIKLENDSIDMADGNVCIVAPNTLHEPFVMDPDSFVINLSMPRKTFEAAFAPILLQNTLVAHYVQTILYQEGMPNYLFIPSGDSATLKLASKHIAYESRKESSYAFSSCVSWLSVFLCALFESYQSDVKIYQTPKTATQAEHILILEYIQTNFTTVTLASVAEKFHYNKSYLSRLLVQLTGRSFAKIVTELKLTEGRELLLNTDLTLDEIASVIGYSNGDYFSKAFKREFGVSADFYRQAHRNS